MAEYDINAKITYDTTQATSALKGVSQAAGETAKQTEKVGDTTQKSQVQIGQFGSALGLAGQAAGKLSPALGGIVTMAGSATGVIQSLTSAGLGPLGIALGLASTAIAAFATNQAEASAKSKQFSDQMRENTRSLNDFIAKLREERQLRETGRRLAAGGGTAEEYEAEVARLEARRGLLRQQLGADSREFRAFASSIDADIARAFRMMQAVEAGGGVVETTIAIEEPQMFGPGSPEFEAERARRAGRRRGGGGRGGGGARRPTLEQLMQQAGAGGALSLEGLDMETLGREPEAMAIAQADKGADIEQQRYLEQLDRNRAYLEEREAQEKEAADRLVAINDTVFQALESAFSASVNAWLDGSMSMGEAALEMVKNVAKSLASEAIIQGLKQTALGLSALAVGSPTAAGHFAAAGKWAAVGVAAGVVGAASGAFGGGGGGGGAPAAATGGPALTAGAREGAGTTVVINWGSSGLVYAADRAQLGRDISGMISEAHGRLGRGM